MLLLRNMPPGDPGYWTEDFELTPDFEKAEHFENWPDLMEYVQLLGRMEDGPGSDGLYCLEPVNV